jgi:hypothetical protein
LSEDIIGQEEERMYKRACSFPLSNTNMESFTNSNPFPLSTGSNLMLSLPGAFRASRQIVSFLDPSGMTFTVRWLNVTV